MSECYRKISPAYPARITIFEDARATAAGNAETKTFCSLAELERFLRCPPLERAEKTSAHLFTRAACDGTRLKKNLQPPLLVILDVDKSKLSIEECSERLAMVDIDHVAHTTWSHGKVANEHSYRVFVDYVADSAEQLEEITRQLFAVIGVDATSESWGSPWFFVPAVHPERKGSYRFKAVLGGGSKWIPKISEPAAEIRPRVRDAQAVDAEELRNALKAIDNSPRENWIEVGMALHSTGLDEARSWWDEWSRSNDYPDYSDEAQEGIWNSFRERTDGVTVATIFHRARARGWKPICMTAQEDFADIAEASATESPCGNPAPNGDEAELQRLAGLKLFEYERERDAAASRMGVRIGILDDEVGRRRPQSLEPDRGSGTVVQFEEIEPWPDPVDGAVLISELAVTFSRFLTLPDHAADAMALWTVHAHAHDAAQISPVLALVSPEKRCGKTTALSVLQGLVARALPAANITAAALFRSVEEWSPTLLIDEADTFLKGSDELRGILNSGHNRRQAFVIRTVGDDHEPRQFRTWGPKAIALIGALPSTLEDRAVVIQMRRRLPDQRVERLRADRDLGILDLRRRCARWVADHRDALQSADPMTPTALNDRAADNWRPLLAIADAAGNDWPNRARTAAMALATREDEGSTGVLLLSDIRTAFDERPGVKQLLSRELCDVLNALEERPWATWFRGKALTANALARLLRPFRIRSRKLRIGESTPNGYILEDFGDAFGRYLASVEVASEPTGTPEHVNGDNGLRANRVGTSRASVLGAKRSNLLD